jgi:hypothetical protein
MAGLNPKTTDEKMPSLPQPSTSGSSEWVGTSREGAQNMVDRATNRNIFVKFMIEKLEEVGDQGTLLLPLIAQTSSAVSFVQKPLYLLPDPALGLHSTPRRVGLQAGCKVGKEFIRVEQCQAEVGGGFRPPDGVSSISMHVYASMQQSKGANEFGCSHVECGHILIYIRCCIEESHANPVKPPFCFCLCQVVICHNHLSRQEEIEHALTHELIHAYDHCRASNIDWTNCQHHACSEIRAASLSGEEGFGCVGRGEGALQGGGGHCEANRQHTPESNALLLFVVNARRLQFQNGGAARQCGPARAAPALRTAAGGAVCCHESILRGGAGAGGGGSLL